MATPLPPEPNAAVGDVQLVIRADGTAAMGLGHVMRCLAIAEAWIELGGRVLLATADLPVAVAERYEAAGARVAMIRSTEDAAVLVRDLGARFAVLDGYHLGADDQAALARTGARLLVIDDRGETATPAAAVVLNQNANASAELYDGIDAKLLLGTQYTLLRREFRAVAALRAIPEVARRVLVSFGGSDPANVAPRAIEAVAPLEGLDVLVIAGVANPHAAELAVPANARATIRIVPSVDDMAAQMKWAELAVVAAGGTCWELAACGVPMIAIGVAENQVAVTESIGELGIGVPMELEAVDGDSLRAMVLSVARDEIWRGHMSRKGREIFDGRGALRVCMALRDDGDAR
jgi:UDP-2,4-diacetamido-2,4,6-trideoxy-beta-L-altropyranose hydrolase